jgi:hypothetical protein
MEAHLGGDVAAGVQIALSHHFLRRRSEREQMASFGFQDEKGSRTDPYASYDVTLDPTTEELLEMEAANRGTTTTQIAVEAVLAFLASLDMARSRAA